MLNKSDRRTLAFVICIWELCADQGWLETLEVYIIPWLAGAKPNTFQRNRKEACFFDNGGAEAGS